MGLSGGDLFDIEAMVTGLVPKPAAAKPPAVRLDGSPGTSTEFGRADHTHEAKVQRTVGITNASGITSVDGLTDIHTSVTVKAQRSRALPATILTLVSLVNFDIFGLIAPGVKINLGAAEPTQ